MSRRAPAVADAVTLGDLLQCARGVLLPSRTASLDAEVLMGYVLGRERPWVLAHPEARVGDREAQRFMRLIQRRADGEPVAYLRGFVEWYGMRLAVTPDVLIPRPETELLLDEAVRVARETGARRLADVGTGSGALAVGLAMALDDAQVVATDISEAALVVAGSNVRLRTNCVRLAAGDLATPIDEEPELIVANLPYLSNDMMETLGRDVGFEPANALRGGHTGLELYDRLVDQIRARGWCCPLLIEIDPRQALAICSRYPGYGARILHDYAGHERVAVLEPSP